MSACLASGHSPSQSEDEQRWTEQPKETTQQYQLASFAKLLLILSSQITEINFLSFVDFAGSFLYLTLA